MGVLRRGLCAFMALALCVVGLPLAGHGAARAEAREPVVVSMGDSYSSGEGVEPFYGQEKLMVERQYDRDWLAHRSWESWPGKLWMPGLEGPLRDHRGTNWYFVAASGAEVKHLYENQWKEYDREGIWGSQPLYPQMNIFVDLAREGKQVDFVTLTLGGNDAGFVDVIKTAATEFKLGVFPTFKLEERLAYTWAYFWNEEYGIRKQLHDAYMNIAVATGFDPNARSGGAHIFVVGYPQLLSTNFFKNGGQFFSIAEAIEINVNVHQFNEEIRKLVEQCRDQEGMDIEFVSVEEAFAGHEAYSDDPYLYHVMLIPNDQDLVDNNGTNLPGVNKLVPSSYSMHPNFDGILVYQQCVQRAINLYYSRKWAEATPTPSPEPTPTPTPRADTSGVVPGDFLIFGAYAPYEGMEGTVEAPIRWRVLDAQADALLLLSEDVLEARPYDNRDLDDYPYGETYMRTWHLRDILERGFTDAERACILTARVSNGGDPETYDQLFLLSVDELERYLPGEADRVAYATESAKIRGWAQVDWEERAYWWTRTRGDNYYKYAYVRPDGIIDEAGEALTYSFYGIRPAMWVTPAALSLGTLEAAEADEPWEDDSDLEGYDDGEAALMDLLIETYPGEGDVLSFGYADYDGDGEMEAFAMMGVYDDETFENQAELWYVCKDFAVRCEREGGCYPFECGVTNLDGLTCFCVSEGYFGSGGALRYWSAQEHRPFLWTGEYMLENLNVIG